MMNELRQFCRGSIERAKQFKDWKDNEYLVGRIDALETVLREIEQIESRRASIRKLRRDEK